MAETNNVQNVETITQMDMTDGTNEYRLRLFGTLSKNVPGRGVHPIFDEYGVFWDHDPLNGQDEPTELTFDVLLRGLPAQGSGNLSFADFRNRAGTGDASSWVTAGGPSAASNTRKTIHVKFTLAHEGASQTETWVRCVITGWNETPAPEGTRVQGTITSFSTAPTLA